MLNAMIRDGQALKEDAAELNRLSRETGFTGWIEFGSAFQGDALVLLGNVPEGLALVREGIESKQIDGCYLPGALRTMAEAQGKLGQPDEGLSALAEALDLVEKTGERHWEAELYRLKADLQLMLNDEAGAEANFFKAIEVARQQEARSWELRAATSLARLWQKQDKKDEARQLLGEIYGWFSEGFDTPDLKEARMLLEEIA